MRTPPQGRQLSRREWLSLTAGSVLTAKGKAADLSGFYYRDYSECLPNYLAALARSACQKRDRDLSGLKTPAAVHQRQKWVRQTFWSLVGGEPRRTPLNPRVHGRLDRSDYLVEKLVYESQPGILVSANLYIPTHGDPPFPGVLFQMGHAVSGKAYESYQKCCQGLVKLGYVVLAFDPMGQGERIGYLDASGTNTRLDSVDEEHSRPGKQFLLLGDSATRYQVWDAIRSLDYLAAHHLVDSNRLASAGQSGGATVSMLLGCVDRRLSAVAISSGNTENFARLNFIAPGSTDDAEQDLIGSGIVGFDRWDLLYPIAPKPLLIQISAHDFFGTYSPQYLADGREQFARLAGVYDLLGHPERLAWRSTPLMHGLTYELRMGIYNWFERWLKNSKRLIEEEPPVAPEEESTLWAGPTGNVTRDFQSLRPFDLIKERAMVLSNHPVETNRWVRAWNIRLPAPSLRMRTLAETPLAGIRVRATETNPAPNIWTPAWLFAPNKPDVHRPPLIILDDRGRNVQAHEDGVYHKLAQEGRVIYAADVRGIGDARPEVGRGNPGYTIPHNSEEEFGWASLILGDSLLAQRIVDVLAIAHALAMEFDYGQGVAMAARGRLTVPALFAFTSSERISSLFLSGGLASYRSLLETEDYQQSSANFAWRLLEYTDLPELASSVATRRIHLAGAVDGSNHSLPPEAVRAIYPDARIQISAEALWDEAALRAV